MELPDIACSPYAQGYHLKKISELLSYAKEKLSNIGCMKINLQIMEGNEAVEKFYLLSGYQTEKRISMGKRIQQNIKPPEQDT